MPRSSLHIQISAHDRPGILAETLEFIVKVGWNVLDIKQFVFNGMLNLSILLDEDDESLIPPLKEALADYGEQKGLKVAISPWKSESQSEAPYPTDRLLPFFVSLFHQRLFWKSPKLLPTLISISYELNNWIRGIFVCLSS